MSTLSCHFQNQVKVIGIFSLANILSRLVTTIGPWFAHLNTVCVTFQCPLVVSSLNIPQLDGGILGCGDHDTKYGMKYDPENRQIEVKTNNCMGIII